MIFVGGVEHRKKQDEGRIASQDERRKTNNASRRAREFSTVQHVFTKAQSKNAPALRASNHQSEQKTLARNQKRRKRAIALPRLSSQRPLSRDNYANSLKASYDR
jgi:hypothetical protein